MAIILCEKCGSENYHNNVSCIQCKTYPLNGSIQDINNKKVLKFLRERKIIEGWETKLTKYNGGYYDGKQVDFIQLMTELLNENRL